MYTPPIVWGGVLISITSDPTQASETDSAKGQNLFSVQTNTNFFSCSTCSAGYPLPQSATGDQAWVQFTDQSIPPHSSDLLCIAEWDLTVSNATNDANGDAWVPTSPCVIAKSTQYRPLTGPGAASGEGQVIGYILCPPDTEPDPNVCISLLICPGQADGGTSMGRTGTA